MKSKLFLVALLAAAALPASATVSLSYQFGVARDMHGVAVPDGTLWAIVGDTNADGLFPGGFSTNASIYGLPAAQALNTFYFGQTLAVGSALGEDRVLAMGGFNGTENNGLTGIAASFLMLPLGVNGAAAGQNFAFYWFPGSTFTTGLNTVGNEIGGINTLLDDIIGGTGPMSLGADGSTLSVGAATAEAGGVTSNAGFTAVSVSEFTAALIPEPSTALLGALSALGLIRRRRLQLASV